MGGESCSPFCITPLISSHNLNAEACLGKLGPDSKLRGIPPPPPPHSSLWDLKTMRNCRCQIGSSRLELVLDSVWGRWFIWSFLFIFFHVTSPSLANPSRDQVCAADRMCRDFKSFVPRNHLFGIPDSLQESGTQSIPYVRRKNAQT